MIYAERFANVMKEHAGELYSPSNGTEGELFMAGFCERCRKDNFNEQTGTGGCDILCRSMAFDTSDDEYPREWVISTDGQPTCTAFEFREGA